ncbi:MAG: tripartite tricarboxylate transporter TctB family protein [Natronospirillum sp.]
MIHIANRKIQVDWGHLLVATLIVAACVWYLFDARGTSLRTSNLIFIQPGVIFAIILYFLVLPQCFRVVTDGDVEPEETSDEPGEEKQDLTPRQFLRVASLAAAFGVFVFSMEAIGFDVAAWLFVTVGLFIAGERRAWVLAVFPLVFAALIVYGYSMLIPYPFPTLII